MIGWHQMEWLCMDKGQQTDIRIRLLSCSVYIGLDRISIML